jgi:hypothetical protein
MVQIKIKCGYKEAYVLSAIMSLLLTKIYIFWIFLLYKNGDKNGIINRINHEFTS